MAELTREEFLFAAKAPNVRAETHFGDLLRKALEARMKSR